MASLIVFYRLMVRPLGREPVRTALTIFAVALGVAVVVAIHLAGEAATGSFRSSLESLTGDADLEISAIGGLDETLLAKLTALPYPLRFSSRLEGYALVEPEGISVPVFGFDLIGDDSLERAVARDTFRMEFLTDDRSVWVGPRLAERPGETIKLTLNAITREYQVRGILETEGLRGLTREQIVVMDIAAAQQALAREGRVDRIEVFLPLDMSAAAGEQVIRSVLPEGVALKPYGARTRESRKMLSAFRWNLRVLSYISLVVGAFLIYNTISVSVLRRRAEIGMMRALGATRRGVLAAFLAEAAFFGAIGTAAGLVLGRLLADGAVELMAVTVRTLYVNSQPGAIEMGLGSVLVAAAAGIGVSLLAAFAPAREASHIYPTEAMARGHHEYQVRLRVGRDFALSIALAAAGGAAALAPPIGGRPLFGYLASLLLIAASALATPAIVQAVARLTSGATRRLFGAEGLLASRSMTASLPRTSVLVGALATAVAMLVSVGIMVGSYRETVIVWLDGRLRADLYIRPAGPAEVDRHPTMDPSLADRIEALPEVDAVDRFRAYPISYNGLPATLGVGQSRVVGRLGNLRLLAGPGTDQVLEELRGGENVIVSEAFANKHGLRVDDSVALPLGDREVSFRVAGIYYDYSNERGYVIADRAVMRRYLSDVAPSNLAVWLKPGISLEPGRRAIESVTAGHNLYIASNRLLRSEALKVFDGTFAITYALEVVAILVAIMGMAGALLAMVINRRREIGVLRFLGASGGQIRRLILFESGFLGLLANLVGLVLGTLLSLILIFVVNKQSFGWTIQFHWPVELLLVALTLIYVAAVVAGIYPARMAAALVPIEVVHEE